MHVEGEALTNDEVMGLLRKQEEEKRTKKKGTEKKGPRRDKGKQRQKAHQGRNLRQLSCLKAVTKTLTTALHVVVYTLTQRCVSGLAVTVATGGTTSNVQVSKGYPRKRNSLYATYVKITALNFGICSSKHF